MLTNRILLAHLLISLRIWFQCCVDITSIGLFEGAQTCFADVLIIVFHTSDTASAATKLSQHFDLITLESLKGLGFGDV